MGDPKKWQDPAVLQEEERRSEAKRRQFKYI